MRSDHQLTSRTPAASRRLTHRSHEREVPAAGEKASALPPRRRERHGASREPHRGVNFATGEIEELRRTSEIVPVGHGYLVHSDIAVTKGGNASGRMRKNSVDSDAASTMAPGSTEASPMLGILVADGNALTWPSLRETTTGWDFCSDKHDDDDEDDDDHLWQDLPEPAVSLDDPSTSAEFPLKLDASPAPWFYVPACGYASPASQSQVPPVFEDKQVTTGSGKPSYAAVVQDQTNDQSVHVLPPSFGIKMPKLHALPVQRHNTGASTACEGQDTFNEDVGLGFASQYHGWTNEHKAAWNKKYAAKREQQKAGRADQRQMIENCGDEDAAED